jgi:hypothetical protein
MGVALRASPSFRRGAPRAGPPALYLLVSFLYFGLPVVTHPGRSYVGSGIDPEIFIWSFAWWPHALIHGLDPFHTSELWVPDTYNLAWTTSVPGLAVLFAPVTLLAGPVAAYNLAALLMPALDAWSAYLLCRHLAGKTWPALVGGYLFGFSAYILGEQEGHLHLTAVFCVPLAVLVVVRYVEGTLGPGALALRLGLLLGVQLWFSTEVFFSLSCALVLALVLGFAVASGRRRRISAILPALAAAYALAAALASPLLVAMLEHFQSGSINFPKDFPTDLLNPLIPTHLVLTSAWWATGIASHFGGNDAENGGYLGLPTLVIVALFVGARRRRPAGRFVALALGLALLAELGTALHVAGHRLVPLPIALLAKAPLFDNLLPSRLALYSSLAAAVTVACWAAQARRRWLAVVLSLLAVVALLPRLGAGYWKRTPIRPVFFTEHLYRSCLAQGASVLVFPFGPRGDSMLWQAESKFWFRLAGGYLSPVKPAAYENDPAFTGLWYGEIPSSGPSEMIGFAQSRGVTTILVDEHDDGGWSTFFGETLHPRQVGGVLLFPLVTGTAEASAACRAPA